MNLEIIVDGPCPENIQSPSRPGDVGFDLSTRQREYVPANGQVFWLKTGVRVGLPEGYWGRITGRSSSNKMGLLVVDSTIDTGFTGELSFGVRNITDKAMVIPEGTRLGQLIINKTNVPTLRYGKLPTTERGDQGFGSTGT